MTTNNNQSGHFFGLLFNEELTVFQEMSGYSEEMPIEGEATINGVNLVLQRGLSSLQSQLLKWCKESVQSGLSVPIITHDVYLKLLNAEGQASKMWIFYKAYPVKFQTSVINARTPELGILTLELAYVNFSCTEDLSVIQAAGKK